MIFFACHVISSLVQLYIFMFRHTALIAVFVRMESWISILTLGWNSNYLWAIQIKINIFNAREDFAMNIFDESFERNVGWHNDGRSTQLSAAFGDCNSAAKLMNKTNLDTGIQ